MVTPASGPALRVPVYAAARPASTTAANAAVRERRRRPTPPRSASRAAASTPARSRPATTRRSAPSSSASRAGSRRSATGVSPLARGGDMRYAGADAQGRLDVLRHRDARRLVDARDGRAVQRPDRPEQRQHGRYAGVHDAPHVRRQRRPARPLRRRASGRFAARSRTCSTRARTTAPYNNNVLVMPGAREPARPAGRPDRVPLPGRRLRAGSGARSTRRAWAKYDVANRASRSRTA